MMERVGPRGHTHPPHQEQRGQIDPRDDAPREDARFEGLSGRSDERGDRFKGRRRLGSGGDQRRCSAVRRKPG